jgi:hypothetical protein
MAILLYTIPKDIQISFPITMTAGRELTITKTIISENKRPAPKLSVAKFSEPFGTVYRTKIEETNLLRITNFESLSMCVVSLLNR